MRIPEVCKRKLNKRIKEKQIQYDDYFRLMIQAPYHKPFAMTLPVNRCPARPGPPGPPGESLCNQHRN